MNILLYSFVKYKKIKGDINMVAVNSVMLPLGTEAPDFSLKDTTGKIVQRDDFRGRKGLLVMFICNHCPFVKHIQKELVKLTNEYQPKGIGIVGINSNNAEKYPEDSPEKMKEEVAKAGYTFPYLYDETQEVARKYKAACTPDFFLFDEDFKLVYRGQFDDSRPGNSKPIDGKDLRNALDCLLEGKPIPEHQKPSIGCNIKWKPGNEPDYFLNQ